MRNTTVNIGKHGIMIIWDGIYYFELSDYPHITPYELSKLLAYINYEKRHGRETEIVCKDEKLLVAIQYAISNPETVSSALLPEKLTQCTQCKQQGCLTKFVYHTATVENAKSIFTSGKLLSAVNVFKRPSTELVYDKRNAARDPADYFDYIMFAWGNCAAGDILVMERNLSRRPTNEEMEKYLAPGVRYYFRYEDIIQHPKYVFDGYHPVKIKDELVLFDYLYACIIPEQYKHELESHIRGEIIDKVHYLPQDNLGRFDWDEKVYNFICSL